MNETTEQRRERLLAELAEVEAEAAAAVDDAVTEVVEDVSETAHDAADTVQEAAETVSGEAEEATQEIIDSTPELSDEDFDRIYPRVVDRLISEGHLVARETVEEGAAPATEVVEAAEGVPVEPEVTESVGGPESRPPAGDPIKPRSEHWFYRKRRLFGREI